MPNVLVLQAYRLDTIGVMVSEISPFSFTERDEADDNAGEHIAW
jgi:hypothetical protein